MAYFCGVVTRLFDVELRLCSSVFFRCGAFCFGDNKPAVLDFSAAPQVVRSVKPAFIRAKRPQRAVVVFVSFILNGAEGLRHASTCWHSFVYSGRPLGSWLGAAGSAAGLRSGGQRVGPLLRFAGRVSTFQVFYWRYVGVSAWTESSSGLSVCAGSVDWLSGRGWPSFLLYKLVRLTFYIFFM